MQRAIRPYILRSLRFISISMVFSTPCFQICTDDVILLPSFSPFRPPNCRCVSEFWDPLSNRPPSFIIYLPFDVPLRARDVFLGHTAAGDTLIRFVFGFPSPINIRNWLYRYKCHKFIYLVTFELIEIRITRTHPNSSTRYVIHCRS